MLIIWRTAALLIKRHGKDSRIDRFAARRAMLADGELDGRMICYRILEAVEELARTKPAEGRRVNCRAALGASVRCDLSAPEGLRLSIQR